MAYLDGPGGSQVVDVCIDATASYLRRGTANLHGAYVTSQDSEKVLADARTALAALVGAVPNQIAFGQNMTSLAFAVAEGLSSSWSEGDNIVVSELDHRANVDPWIRAAGRRSVEVRWLTVDRDSLALDLERLEGVIGQRTRLVAIGLASNAVGTVTDVGVVARAAAAVGAVVAVDAVHAVPHLPIDRDALGADVLFCSAYKFFGPHVGAVAIQSPLFERLDCAKLIPAPDTPPGKLETGTQNFEGLAGLVAAVGFIASLGTGPSLRDQLRSAMTLIQETETELAARFRTALGSLPRIHMYGGGLEVEKTPTVAFTVQGTSPRALATHLGRRGVFVGDGDFYATTLAERLGIASAGGWVRAGLAPYTTWDELARCIEVVQEFVEVPV